MTLYSNNMNLYLKYEQWGLVKFEMNKSIRRNPPKSFFYFREDNY